MADRKAALREQIKDLKYNIDKVEVLLTQAEETKDRPAALRHKTSASVWRTSLVQTEKNLVEALKPKPKSKK